MRTPSSWLHLETLDSLPSENGVERATEHLLDLERLSVLIQRLRPVDRQVILLYLGEIDSRSIAEITGLSASNVTTKVHRAKEILARQFQRGDAHAKSCK